jgi:hypothetical protein
VAGIESKNRIVEALRVGALPPLASGAIGSHEYVVRAV